MEKNIFILDRPPEPFRENVVHASPASIHADFDVMLKDKARQVSARVLHALVCVPDIRSCDFECVRECFHAEIRFKRGRDFPCDDIPAEPIEDGGEIGEAPFQFYIGDVRSPDLIRTDDVEPAQEIRILLMQWIALAQSLVFPGIDGLNPHFPHKATNVIAADWRLMALRQFDAHPARTIERTVRVNSIDESLDPFIFRIREWDIGEACS